MKKVIISLVAGLCAIISMSLNAVTVQDGVSLELATYRSANINDVSYSLSFTVPDQIARPVSFNETLTFVWAGDEDLQIDFQGRPDQLDSVITVNGRVLTTDLRHEHIIIPKGCLLPGKNQVIISGRCGDKALNRHEDYLYSLFVPDHARSVFPCFDQPDLKARFALSLTLPDGWISISNDTQKPIPTYLFSFTAGRFQMQTATRDGRDLTALYRETDSLKVAQLPIVFDQVALSLRWMEEYTGIPYPFEKYGFVV
jgi:aminopeptidase N